jgi:hypothetical protein
MTQLAKATGMNRESLDKALGEKGNPEFGTVMRIVGALAFRSPPIGPSRSAQAGSVARPRSQCVGWVSAAGA